MEYTVWAGLAGMGFVALAVGMNVLYVRRRLPLPVSADGFDAVVEAFAGVGRALRAPSVGAPAAWACTTIFAAGLLSALWDDGAGPRAWAAVGFAGVLAQNATFTVVEALRFGMAEAAARDRDSFAGLWGLSNVLFGFNQVFLALALVGFSAAGAGAGFLDTWLVVLGYVGAALLFASSSLAPYNVSGAHRLAPVGFVGWLCWATWIVGVSVTLISS